MVKTRVFKNGNSQALRIPQEFKTDTSEYIINKIGDVFIACPVTDPWASAKLVAGSFPEDFMSDRTQPSFDEAETREVL